MLYQAWKHGHDAFALFHRLGPGRRPASDPAAPPVPPAYPSRVQAFEYGCAVVASEEYAALVSASAGRGGRL